MWNQLFKNEKTLYFIGGIASAVIGAKFLKSSASRELCVKGLAQGMRLQMDAMEAFQNIKEDASDVCFDAKKQAVMDEAAK